MDFLSSKLNPRAHVVVLPRAKPGFVLLANSVWWQVAVPGGKEEAASGIRLGEMGTPAIEDQSKPTSPGR